MIRLQSKHCPKCSGTGSHRIAGGAEFVPCSRCDATGMIAGTVRRVVNVPGESRPLVIELREDGVYIREKGRRTIYGPLNYGGLFLAGARQYVEAREQERKGRKAGARSRRRKLSRRKA